MAALPIVAIESLDDFRYLNVGWPGWIETFGLLLEAVGDRFVSRATP